MEGSLRLKTMDERTSHVTECVASKRTNESSECTNGQYNDAITYKQTNKPDNFASKTSSNQTNACKPGNSTNG